QLLDQAEALVSRAQQQEWPEQNARALELRDRIQAALDNLQNPMSMVDPEDMRAIQQPTHGKPVALLPMPGFTLPPRLPNVLITPANAPKLPNQMVFTTPKLDQRPLTHDQEAAAQATSDTWERINQAGRTTTRYLTWGTIGAGIVYTLWLLNGAAAGLAGALLPPELREHSPLAPPRPTQG